MQRRHIALLILLALAPTPVGAQRQMENLTRGVVAVRQPNAGVYVGWRLLGTDPEGVAFNVYRQTSGGDAQRVNDGPVAGATNLVDAAAPNDASLSYAVRPVLDGRELAPCKAVAVWQQGFLEIPIDPIAGYRPGDASAADLDGDGRLDVVLHQSSRGRDNGSTGVTGTPVLDAYRLDGTRLWRIDLGRNIREGEHYTQFMVYDLDGDGRAEVACKTADGATDGVGVVIGDGEKDWRTLQPGSQRDGRVLDGPEYFTIFDGRTGAALKTVGYVPGRDPINGWGGIGGNAGNDSYGNRCDRFLACVAYVDGQRPSVVMCRGVYGRIVMAAWDWRDGELTLRWTFDTGVGRAPYTDASPYSGMGGHSLSVADVDDDGKDEIVYQAMVVDDDGRGLYSTGLRHGDAMFITDMYPDRPGMEVFSVQENEEHAEQFQTPGAAMRDARTGKILWSHSPTVDVGGGMAADIDPTHRGFEAWGGPGGLRDSDGKSIGPAPRAGGWSLWWDGDPLRELLAVGRPAWRGGPGRRGGDRADGWPTQVFKWDWSSKQDRPLAELNGVSSTGRPNLAGDLIGDWREELLLTAPDGNALRLYTTTIPTDIRLRTLLHDPQYRLGLVWQNVVYNRPCYPGFYLGDGMNTPPAPNIRLVGDGEAIRLQNEAPVDR
ncbi:Rhamnogalacturonan endolyase YesW precursor [Pirellulimonas nuda]|uniref:Rhamnogalacturonan endolyase YesW n=1 Tax=Pirellulimonas nuda TaxID=2528009 RepID=A0A518DE93_9BACT|nr:rhamnogalacturonan lyase [Pirellulimonas nuda]QDU89786.1 Rhamnogalacturonan endolyase YesW precursor [Pirellulimonas nuda]